MADSRETQFQQDITNVLQSSGWLVGGPANYDQVRALYTEDLLAFFQEAYPDQWQRFCKQHPQNSKEALLKVVTRELDKRGTLHVLRHGFKVPGVKITLCSFKPDHSMNVESLARYQANRLRVVPEVSYSPYYREGEYNPRLDLVLFVNGIPTATLELKSEFKQSVENAKRQYRNDRPIKDPLTRKPEPLLSFKRGALVHFAVSQYEVAMTTILSGRNTEFLPFNLGQTDGSAGNPPPLDENHYATSYLWERVFQPDAWLNIISRFLHMEKITEEDFHGRRKVKETLIFPRYHQWDVVNKLLAATKSEGPRRRYLIQHSAGSGKSNSIAWVAHQLASLYDDNERKLFDSIVVVTDRTVLDNQLQDTIYQFEHAEGVVLPISRATSNESKSAQLAQALINKSRIIIVTIQTFPALFDALDKYPELAAGRYAVIADEAHSSQAGASATKLKAILGTDRPDGEEISAEELLQAAVTARKPNEQISYYAFTATPKAKTLELFGCRPHPDQPAGEVNLPQPFHLYSMRQAIQEEFILNVLQRYVTYNTAWKLAHPDADSSEVDSRKASAKLARWVKLHPHNINQKVQIIVEHFRANVRHLLDCQAKAMVVTGSRQEAVRYTLEMKQYIKENGYDDVHPLVAFSGTVPRDQNIPDEVTEYSSLLNPGLKGRDHRDAFDTTDYNVLIVANKFQTGFDQPKLCAMYVDKKLAGVDCVQTLSRLNRTFPGKETFVLDFFNDPKDIQEAFEPYYFETELSGISDQQIVYDLKSSLDDSRNYQWDEVSAFAIAFFDPNANASKLSYHCKPARDRFVGKYKQILENIRRWKIAKKQAERDNDQTGLQRAEQELKDYGTSRDELDLFKKNLISFVRAYEFLSQIVDYDDSELEQLCVYAKHLHPLLRIDRLEDDNIDIEELQLTHYRLTKHAEQDLRLGVGDEAHTIDPMTDVGSAKPYDPEKSSLSEIIQKLNDLFGSEIRDEDKLRWVTGIAERIERDEDVMEQVRNHSEEQVMHGRFPKRLTEIVLEAMEDDENLSMPVLEDERIHRAFAGLIYRMLRYRSHFKSENTS